MVTETLLVMVEKDYCLNPFCLQEGMTAIHLAARSGHIHILDVLKNNVCLKISSSKVTVLEMLQK